MFTIKDDLLSLLFFMNNQVFREQTKRRRAYEKFMFLYVKRLQGTCQLRRLSSELEKFKKL